MTQDPTPEPDEDPSDLPADWGWPDTDTAVEVDPALAAAVDNAAPDFRSAIAAHIASHGQCRSVVIPFDSITSWIAMVGGKHHGLGRWETFVDDHQRIRHRWVPITDWVAYRERQRSVHTVDADGRLSNALSITHDMRLVDRRGFSWVVRNVPTAKSSSPGIVGMAGSPLTIPGSPAKRGVISCSPKDQQLSANICASILR